MRDLSPREWVVIAPICAMAILMGVVPGVFLQPMEPAVRKTVQTIVGTPVAGQHAGAAGRPGAPRRTWPGRRNPVDRAATGAGPAAVRTR